jgi:hypothetical protein
MELEGWEGVNLKGERAVAGEKVAAGEGRERGWSDGESRNGGGVLWGGV